MSEHTKEPWRYSVNAVNLIDIWDTAGSIASVSRWHVGAAGSEEENEANARRIVACVNACEGIVQHMLEGHNLNAQIALIESERDALRERERELVEALTDVMRDQLKTVNLHQMAPGPRQRIEKARAVLAKHTISRAMMETIGSGEAK